VKCPNSIPHKRDTLDGPKREIIMVFFIEIIGVFIVPLKSIYIAVLKNISS